MSPGISHEGGRWAGGPCWAGSSGKGRPDLGDAGRWGGVPWVGPSPTAWAGERLARERRLGWGGVKGLRCVLGTQVSDQGVFCVVGGRGSRWQGAPRQVWPRPSPRPPVLGPGPPSFLRSLLSWGHSPPGSPLPPLPAPGGQVRGHVQQGQTLGVTGGSQDLRPRRWGAVGREAAERRAEEEADGEPGGQFPVWSQQPALLHLPPLPAPRGAPGPAPRQATPWRGGRRRARRPSCAQHMSGGPGASRGRGRSSCPQAGP